MMSATRAIWPSMVLARRSGAGPTGRPPRPLRPRAPPGRWRVPCDAVAHLPRQVEALAVVLQHVDDAQALLVVIEPAGNEIVQHPLAGVAERRVAEIVSERDRLGQLFVQPQHLGDA